MEFSSFIFPLSFFIFVVILMKSLISGLRTKPKSSNIVKFPPSPRKLPLIGHLAMKHGPLMHLQLGEVDSIAVSSPKVAKELFKTHDIPLAYHPSVLSSEALFNNSDIVFAPYGAHWRRLRKICTSELLSLREEEVLSLCRWIASKEGCAINLTEKLYLLINDIISRASLGKKTAITDRVAFMNILKECVELAAVTIGDLYPSIKLRGKMKALHQKLDRIVVKIIDDHKADANQIDKHQGLIDVLLNLHDDDAGGELPLTTDDIKSILVDMFTAGSETSATTIDWIMAELLRNPRVMKKVQQEVRQVYDKQGYVDESSLHELGYLTSVIKEGLRLHPPIPLWVRENKKQLVEEGGYEIPIKTKILVNAWALGRDPEYWKEGCSFMPERFLDNSVDYKGNNFEYLPFGTGRRICPGMSFGIASVELPLAMLLYHFDWVLPHGLKHEELVMTETLGAVAARTKPLHVIPIMKRHLPLK